MKISTLIIIFCIGLMAGPAWSAEESWYWKGSGQLLVRNYSDSVQLENLYGVGVSLTGEYLEQGGFTVGYNFNNTDYKAGASSGLTEIKENILFLSGKANYHPDQLPGRLTLRLDGYLGNDEMSYRTTTAGLPMGGGSSKQTITVDDDLTVVSPMVSFLNYAKTFYADLGYAYSSYRSDDNATDDIDISQWTPTLGVGFNQAYDWLQLRAYFISLSSSNRVGDKDSTSALEAKWSHWFSAGAPLNLYSAYLSVLAGERIYAVDADAYSLSNVADLQTDMVAIGAEWKLSERTRVFLQGGYEAYKNLLLNDRYNSTYLYFYMSRSW